MLTYFTQFGYLVIALSMFIEGLTLPCPAVAILLMAGAATVSGKLAFWPVVTIAASAYTIGSIIPFFLGWNIVYIQRFSWAEKITQKSAKHIERLGRLFEKHGEQIVALSRPFWIGNFVSYFAGLARMSFFRFCVLTFGGIFAWSLVVVSMGAAFSANLPKAALLIRQYSVAATVALVVILVGAVLIRSRVAQN